jgi:hypothetical protein
MCVCCVLTRGGTEQPFICTDIDACSFDRVRQRNQKLNKIPFLQGTFLYEKECSFGAFFDNPVQTCRRCNICGYLHALHNIFYVPDDPVIHSPLETPMTRYAVYTRLLEHNTQSCRRVDVK